MGRRPARARAELWMLATALLVASCGSTDRSPQPAEAPAAMAPFTQRCGVVAKSGVEVTDVAIPLPELVHSRLAGAVFHGDTDPQTVVILLHQDEPEGLCGWRDFALQAAARGVTSLAVDLCWYGESQCSGSLEGHDHAEVRAMIDHAQHELGAETVVLMGASLGAHLTVRSVAAGLPVDAWVSVSPPSAYVGVDLEPLRDDLARRDLPGLVVFSRADGLSHFKAARSMAREAGVPFLSTPPGHGYELLTAQRRPTEAGQRVLAFLLEQ